jgi:hypothetical protein
MSPFLLYFLSSSLCVFTAKRLRNHPTKIIDLVHTYLPHINPPLIGSYLSDVLVAAQLLYTLKEMPSFLYREFALIMGITQLCRVLCMISTILPPLKNYDDKARLMGVNGSGTEYIFSGHASYSAASFIYLYALNIISPKLLILYNILSQSLIIASRNHYTVDVVLSWIIVPLIYGNRTNFSNLI